MGLYLNHRNADRNRRETMEKKIAAARLAVRNENFGTEAWEAKMQVVRALVDQQNAAQTFTHTSVDGDVWSV